MSRRTLLPFLIVVLGAAASTNAQWYEPGQSYFEPLVEFEEFDALDTGYFTAYERLVWAEHTERVTVGSPNAIRSHMELLGRGAPDATGIVRYVGINPIGLPTAQNGLGQVFPDFEFDSGNRFTFGHRGDGGSWEVSVLTPFEMTRDQLYGQGFTGQDGTVGGAAVTAAGTPIIDGDGVEFLDGTDEGQLPDSQTQLVSPYPFGSVMILFDYDAGLMDGFIDLAEAPGTSGVAIDDTTGDGFLDGDGVADDLNQNGVNGPDSVDANGVRLIDFGDLVELPTSFRLVDVRNILKTSSIEIMRSKRFQSPRNGRTGAELLYGFRYLDFDDQFFVRGEGGVLGRSFWNTAINNRLMGPQIGVRWVKTHGRWGLTADARGLVAVNVENWEQDASIGEDLVPSSNNHPLYFSPTVSHHGRKKYEFAPMGELKLSSSYQLTKGVSLNVGYNGLFATGVRRASTHVHYRLPNMGFVDGRTENILISGVNLGITFAH
ncbi:MAG: BBP7 family outer membrane beta-barrel protein [Planctomycetales bacterium]|nr:BBP7 family outer membrane beta-barrel protein [Planctomycetales bacterium]